MASMLHFHIDVNIIPTISKINIKLAEFKSGQEIVCRGSVKFGANLDHILNITGINRISIYLQNYTGWFQGKIMEKHLLSEKIKSLAESLGLDAVGFTKASEFSEYLSLMVYQPRFCVFQENI